MDSANEDNSSDEEGEGLQNEPSSGIKSNLVSLLKRKTFKSSGSFSSSHFFENAPNPVLNLDGVGIVGLPLSESAAKQVISGCRQAPFGKGKRTVIDKKVRDTWEMDATKVCAMTKSLSSVTYSSQFR